MPPELVFDAGFGELFIVRAAVETYRARLMQKLQLEDLVALVKFAIRNGMSSVDLRAASSRSFYREFPT